VSDETQLYIDNVLIPASKVVLSGFDWVPNDAEASFNFEPLRPFPAREITAFFTATWRSSPLFRRWIRPHHHFTGHRHRGTTKWARRYAHR